MEPINKIKLLHVLEKIHTQYAVKNIKLKLEASLKIPSIKAFEGWYRDQTEFKGFYLSDDLIDGESGCLSSEGIDEFNHLSKKFNKLSSVITLYRAIGIKDIKRLNTKAIGRHWSLTENTAKCMEDIEDTNKTFIFKAQVKKGYVEWNATFLHNLYYGEDENEITLKSGSPLIIVGYRNPQGKWLHKEFNAKV